MFLISGRLALHYCVDDPIFINMNYVTFLIITATRLPAEANEICWNPS